MSENDLYLGTDVDFVLVLGGLAGHEEGVGADLLQEVQPYLAQPPHPPLHRLSLYTFWC